MKKLLLIFCLVPFYSEACSDLLDTDMRLLDSAETKNLCEFEGKAMLVVNVASRCGYTYQYAELQNLFKKYEEKMSEIDFADTLLT